MIAFRHVDPRFPFLFEDDSQPPGRWHAAGEGPVQYLADTPDGAWAELLRHEEIRDLEDLSTIRRALWAVELREEETAEPRLPEEVLTGGRATYAACRAEARRLRAAGVRRLVATSAALLPGAASGWRVDGGLREAAPREGRMIVLFGIRPEAVGWLAAEEGRPGEELLSHVRHFSRERTTRQRTREAK